MKTFSENQIKLSSLIDKKEEKNYRMNEIYIEIKEIEQEISKLKDSMSMIEIIDVYNY